jgi:hypothetical protein
MELLLFDGIYYVTTKRNTLYKYKMAYAVKIPQINA